MILLIALETVRYQHCLFHYKRIIILPSISQIYSNLIDMSFALHYRQLLVVSVFFALLPLMFFKNHFMKLKYIIENYIHTITYLMYFAQIFCPIKPNLGSYLQYLSIIHNTSLYTGTILVTHLPLFNVYVKDSQKGRWYHR